MTTQAIDFDFANNRITLTWTSFKEYLNGTLATLKFHYLEYPDKYTVLSERFGTFNYICYLSRDGGADVTDFENNFKALAVRDPVPQPVEGDTNVSGTVTVNPGSTFTISGSSADNSANSSNKLPVIAARANAANPSWTEGNMVPLSVDNSGALRVGGSFTATNPSVGSTGSTVPTSATLVGASDGTNLLGLRGSTSAPSGTENGLIVRNIPSGTQPVSASSLPLPTGASTSALQTTGNTSLSNIDTKTPALGQAVMAASSPVVIASNQSAIPITDNAGSLTVDGTVAATQSGTWNITNVSGTVSLPTGASTSALQTTGNTSLSSIDGKTPALGQAVMASSTPVAIASNQSAIPVSDGGGSLTVDGSVSVSGTVTANIGTTGGLALDATLTGGTQKAIARGGAKGATVAADITSTAQSADRQALDVQIRTSAGAVVDTFGGGTQFADGAARGTATGTLMMVDDGTNIQSAKGDTAGVLAVQDNGGSLTVDGTVTANQGTANTIANGWPVKITDGTSTAAVKPASTAPLSSDQALVVVLSPNQTAIPVTSAPISATPGLTLGDITTTVIATVAVRRTTYTEQTSNAQRSLVSASANDTSAGTGARTVKITYLDSTGAGPYTETVTMNGTSAVNTVATNICFIEKIEVITAGSTGSNVGIVSLKAATGGGGATIWTIGATDNITFGCHHYVPTGKTCHIGSQWAGHNGTVVGSGGTFIIKYKPIGVANAVEKQISDSFRLYGQSSSVQRDYDNPITAVGPARLVTYVTPETSSSVNYRASFDWYED